MTLIRYSRLFIYFLLIVITRPNICKAQTHEIARYAGEQGLSQGMITSLCEDKDGFIWAGTLSGLNRYDGTNFKTYMHNSNDPYSPASNTILEVICDSKDRLWIGFNDEGIDCYDRKSGRFYHLGNAFNVMKFASCKPNKLYETADGHIWISGGTFLVEMIVPTDFPVNPESIKKIKYNGFYYNHGFPYADSGSWIVPLVNQQLGVSFATDPTKSVYRFDLAKRVWHKMLNNESPTRLEEIDNTVFYDAFRKGYWFVKNDALHLFKNNRIEQEIPLSEEIIINTRQHDKYISHEIKLHIDNFGTIWIINGFNLYKITYNNALSSQIELVLGEKAISQPLFYVLSMHPSLQGSIWLGTSGYGLYKIMPKQTQFHSSLKGTSLRNIQLGATSNELLIQNGQDLCKWDKNNTLTNFTITHKNKTIYNVSKRLQLADGTIFTEYLADGLIQFLFELPNGQKLLYNKPSGHFFNQPYLIDKSGRLWLCSKTGMLYYWQPYQKEFTYFPAEKIWTQPKSNIEYKQIYQSKDETFWVASQQGLIHIRLDAQNNPSFKIFPQQATVQNSLNSKNLLCVIDDPEEPNTYLWIGTNGSGLNKMNKHTGECIYFTKQDGLPDNVVYGILIDKQKRLWLSTNFGISCFTPQNKHFRNFTKADGLQDNEFNTFSFFQDNDGVMYFGGINGLTWFSPDKIVPKNTFPDVYFTALKVNNQTIELGDKTNILQQPIEFTQTIHLKHNQNFLNISFSALNYANKNENAFYYKLDGVDLDWVYTNTQKELSYPNLASGTYTLHIKAISESGMVSPKETVLTFIISPPWWRTWAAYLVYVFSIGLIIRQVFKAQIARIKLQNDYLLQEADAKRLHEIDELKTKFFTNITHEFRTPLTLIIEPTRQLLLAKEFTDFSKQQLRIIINNANRLLLLVNQLLDLSKIEAGKLDVHWSEGDVLPLLKEIVEVFSPVIDKKKQTLNWDCQLSTLNCVSDFEIMKKISYNLVSNAHKFTPEEGTITISISQPQPNSWQLIVKDTGIGIPKEKIPFIFDRFYQTDNSLTRRSEGTGIGLSLVKELCELIGGTIDIQSEINKGTALILSFPLRPEGNVTYHTMIDTDNTVISPEIIIAQTENTPIENEKAQATILLVEDNPEMRAYLKMVLLNENYKIIEAENGKIGIETAIEQVPDLIISDVMMPETNGYQLTESLKSHHITSHIPIMLLTAKDGLESKIEGYKKGADAYLAKPFHTGELMVRIQQLLETRYKIQQKYQQYISHSPQIAFAPSFEDTEKNNNHEASQQPSMMTTEDTEWVAKLEGKIHEYLHEDAFTVNDLPRHFGMNRTQFYAKVKSITGLTPAKLLRDLRLKKSYQLLMEQPELSVKEVMIQVGFNDIKNFKDNFKAQFGVNPQDIRNQDSTKS